MIDIKKQTMIIVSIEERKNMNIKLADTTIKQLLLSKKQFVIPRFQREYSWDKKNYQEFIEDMVDNLSINSGTIKHNQYFLGTMLFIGDVAEVSDQEILVVDGQQRLTTITILFSALSDKFKTINENGLSSQLFKYVMTKDDDENDIRILVSKTHYPFFAYYIQDSEKQNSTEPTSEEEICIKETYDYYSAALSEQSLKRLLERKHGNDTVEALSYTDILKAIRDQVLNSTIITISTRDEQQANKIFEILNAKGKRLAHIDLIKNKIFEILDQVEPADYAEETWNNIRNTLYAGKENVGLATFYRHYWISKYKKTSSTKLYDDFLKDRASKNRDACKQFITDMLINAKYYMQILNPKLDDYNNRKEYAWLVQSLKNLINDFGIVQVRIALLALFDVKHRGLISTAVFKKTIKNLEKFHFAYNSVMALGTNRLEKIYSTFAIAIRKSNNKTETQQIINTKLIEPLNNLFPSKDAFCDRFEKLYYSKKRTVNNIKTKYAINMLQCHYSGKEIFEPDGSIEHLYPENKGTIAWNIGNLILLEGGLNNDAGEMEYKDKCSKVYPKSQYKWIGSFIQENPEWDETKISDRASMMAETFYDKVLGRENEST